MSKINRYKPCSSMEVIRMINDTLKTEGAEPLSRKQESALSRNWDMRGMYGNLGVPFQVYLWKKEEKTGTSFWWRLTFPLFYIFGIILVYYIGGLFRWLFTGRFQMNPNSKLYEVLERWERRVIE